MSLTSALEQLATYRVQNSRASQDTFLKGSLILENNAAGKMGNESWAFLEQLALASIDVGRLDIADECLKQLTLKFPGSPRIDVLTGIRMEASESTNTVLQYYDELLTADSANAVVWKRRISILRRTGQVEKAVEELSQFLDTFYTDVEGWLELADIYASCNQYTPALQTLSHVLLLAPQNPFHFLQFAETAYTASDIPLALKMFLVVTDMCERDIESPADKPSIGIALRAWWGVKLCSRHLGRFSSQSASNTPVPKNLNLIDELATERVMSSYSTTGKASRGGKDAEGKDEVFKWISVI